MEEKHRERLKEIVSKYGLLVYDDLKRLRELLNYFSPGYSLENHLIALAASDGFVDELLYIKVKDTYNLEGDYLKKKMAEESKIMHKSADWAIDSWAYALGIIGNEVEIIEEVGEVEEVLEVQEEAMKKDNSRGESGDLQVLINIMAWVDKSNYISIPSLYSYDLSLDLIDEEAITEVTKENSSKKKSDEDNLKVEEDRSSERDFKEDMVLVEGGTFKRGRKDITLSNFSISKYQVTQKLYREVTGANPLNFVGDMVPVESFSWFDAIEFCNELSQREGLAVAYNLETGDLLDSLANPTEDTTEVEGYRLPTEAEWEYAARGGNESRGYKYAGGDELAQVAWFMGNSASERRPVGLKKANELGLYDMSGNVWEWCQDYYDSIAYRKVGDNNPYMTEGGSDRVRRGGSRYRNAGDCELSFRGYHNQWSSYSSRGLRLVRSHIG